MATNYDVNYEDERFQQVETDKQAAMTELEQTYDGMIDKTDSFYQAQIDASKEAADKQSQLQQERTDFAIQQIEQQKEQSHKDYLKEQSGAYADWQKQSNEYGVNAEAQAAQGMTGTGFSESSQVAMYNAYQHRVAQAKESYNQAVLNYNNAMTEAKLQNNSALAQIALDTLQQQLQLALDGFQSKNALILDLAGKKVAMDNQYYGRHMDVLAQINQENALAEQIRQFNESMAFEQQKYADSQKRRSGGGGGPLVQIGETGVGEQLTYTDVAYTAAELKNQGASKQEILQYINEVTGYITGGNYKATNSAEKDRRELISSYVGNGR